MSEETKKENKGLLEDLYDKMSHLLQQGVDLADEQLRGMFKELITFKLVKHILWSVVLLLLSIGICIGGILSIVYFDINNMPTAPNLIFGLLILFSIIGLIYLLPSLMENITQILKWKISPRLATIEFITLFKKNKDKLLG